MTAGKKAKKDEVSQAEEYVSNLQELHKIQGVLLMRLAACQRRTREENSRTVEQVKEVRKV